MDNTMKTSQARARPLPSNEELLNQIRLLLDSPEDDLQAVIMKELLAGTLRLHDSHLDILDLKIVNRAVKELRHAFRVFHDYRDRRKISIFGSARTEYADLAPIAIVMKDAEGMTQLLDGAVDDLEVQNVQMRIVEPKRTSQEFLHDDRLQIVFWTIQQEANLVEQFLVRREGTGTGL